MASKTFLTRKKTEGIENSNGAGGDISSIGFAPPNSDGSALALRDTTLSPMPFGSMSSNFNGIALRGTPRLPTITMPTAVALAQMQPSYTQQSAGGGGIRFTPPFAHPGAPSNSHSSTGGLNWRHWGQLYAEQDRSPLPPARSSSDMGFQTATQPMPQHRPHPAFSTGSKDSIVSSGLTLLAETLACLDGPTPPPPVSGRFIGDGGTNGASLLYRDGEGALRGLTPIPVNVPSVKPTAATSSTSSHASAAAALPKPGPGKVNHPGALGIYQDVSLSTSTNVGGPAAKRHTQGALLRIDNGNSNVPVAKGRKKGRKAADAFPEVDEAKGGGGGEISSGTKGDNSKKKRKKTSRWTKEEDDILRRAVEADTNAKTDWKSIAASHFAGSRDASHCRTRWSKHLDPEVSKKPFTAEEDRVILQKLVEGKSFADIAKLLPGRITEQVRRRWESLQPKKKGSWTEAEVKILVEKHREYGNNWSMIAKFIDGRTITQIKNRWHNYQANQEKVKQEPKSEE